MLLVQGWVRVRASVYQTVPESLVEQQALALGKVYAEVRDVLTFGERSEAVTAVYWSDVSLL